MNLNVILVATIFFFQQFFFFSNAYSHARSHRFYSVREFGQCQRMTHDREMRSHACLALSHSHRIPHGTRPHEPVSLAHKHHGSAYHLHIVLGLDTKSDLAQYLPPCKTEEQRNVMMRPLLLSMRQQISGLLHVAAGLLGGQLTTEGRLAILFNMQPIFSRRDYVTRYQNYLNQVHATVSKRKSRKYPDEYLHALYKVIIQYKIPLTWKDIIVALERKLERIVLHEALLSLPPSGSRWMRQLSAVQPIIPDLRVLILQYTDLPLYIRMTQTQDINRVAAQLNLDVKAVVQLRLLHAECDWEFLLSHKSVETSPALKAYYQRSDQIPLVSVELDPAHFRHFKKQLTALLNLVDDNMFLFNEEKDLNSALGTFIEQSNWINDPCDAVLSKKDTFQTSFQYFTVLLANTVFLLPKGQRPSPAEFKTALFDKFRSLKQYEKKYIKTIVESIGFTLGFSIYDWATKMAVHLVAFHLLVASMITIIKAQSL